MKISADGSSLEQITSDDINENGHLKVAIPNSVTHIEREAFRNCINLTSITTPDSVTYIGNQAFAGCTSLTNITIRDSAICLDSWSFRGCTNLTSIIIDSDNEADLARITAFLPEVLQDKVVSKQANKDAQVRCKAALKRISNDPRTTNASQLIWTQRSLSFFPQEIFGEISAFCDNKYADEAREEMCSVKIPTDNNWVAYVAAVKAIAARHIGKAADDFANDAP